MCTGSQEISALGLFGNYSIPATNPFVGVKNAQPEIWAYGLRNPWRFSFDSQYPTYFYCGDVGEVCLFVCCHTPLLKLSFYSKVLQELLTPEKVQVVSFCNFWSSLFSGIPVYIYHIVKDIGGLVDQNFFVVKNCGFVWIKFQTSYEEVDLISKGGNYGWRVYEGFHPFAVGATPGGNTSASSINPIWPIIEYNHSITSHGYAAIIAGYVSHSSQDPCVYGK
jgi:hypothetical protein